jgi:hypothetical protein
MNDEDTFKYVIESFLLLLGSESVHHIVSLDLGSSVSAQGFLSNLKGFLGVLEGAGLEKLNDSLFVC